MKTVYVKLEIEESQFEEEGISLKSHFDELSTCINLLEIVELEDGESIKIESEYGDSSEF